MPKSLSPRAQSLIAIDAQNEARQCGSELLFPEHVLLALLKGAVGLGYLLFRKLNINVLNFQTMLEGDINNESSRSSSPIIDVPPSPRMTALLDAAAQESQTFGHNYIGTEHLVLAAIREEDSLAWRFFRGAKIDLDTLYRTVRDIAADNPSSAMFDEPADDLERDRSGASTGGGSAATLSRYRNRKNNPRAEKPYTYLGEFSHDLTEAAANGEIDPVIGRDREIQRVMQILSRRTKNNPVLIGDPGVGKTAVVEGLAQKIAGGRVPQNLLDKKVLTLDMGLIIAGTKYRGEFEERIKRIMKEVMEQKNIILFIDEIHTIIGAGSAEGTMDAANMLKPALSRGELQCVGATTLKEYRKYFERDAALERRFQSVTVEEPGDEDARLILEGIKHKYEEYHAVTYDNGVIDRVVRFARRYIPERFLPDKAIDILDEAGAMKRLEDEGRPRELQELEDAIAGTTAEKTAAAKEQHYERAAELRDKANILRQKLEEAQKRWIETTGRIVRHVTVADVCTVMETMTGIPAAALSESETRRLLAMEAELHKSVVGQDDAVSAMASSIRRSRAGVSSAKRPLGSFVFLGPTGVGKTLLAKTLATFLFGSEDALIRVDMSDFMDKHNVSRLTGAPPGYVGYEEGGMLTEKVRRKPYSVVLFDEVEKAHSDVFNVLLQLLEEGELQDSLDHKVSFRNTVVIMTSNAGTRDISSDYRLGFSDANGTMSYDQMKRSAIAEFKKTMNPELFNRIDDILVFSTLSREQVAAVLDMRIDELAGRLGEKGLTLSIDDGARAYLAEKGYDSALGARPMRRLLQREIEDKIASALLENDIKGGHVSVSYGSDAVTVTLNGNNTGTASAEQVEESGKRDIRTLGAAEACLPLNT